MLFKHNILFLLESDIQNQKPDNKRTITRSIASYFTPYLCLEDYHKLFQNTIFLNLFGHLRVLKLSVIEHFSVKNLHVMSPDAFQCYRNFKNLLVTFLQNTRSLTTNVMTTWIGEYSKYSYISAWLLQNNSSTTSNSPNKNVSKFF